MNLQRIALFALVYWAASAAIFGQEMIYSQARQKSKIDTLFPFDIKLMQPDSTSILSSKIFKKGKPTVLAFWLTTCYPCQIELNEYSKNYENWKKEADFDLIAVSTDFPKNYRNMKKRATELPFPVLWDSVREFREILPGGLNGLPQIFIFDKNGKIAFHKKGFSTGDEAALFSKIKSLQ